jgi:hypothetical protein
LPVTGQTNLLTVVKITDLGADAFTRISFCHLLVPLILFRHQSLSLVAQEGIKNFTEHSFEVSCQVVRFVLQICCQLLVRRFEIPQGPVAVLLESLNSSLVCFKERLAEHIDMNLFLADQLVALTGGSTASALPRTLTTCQL